MLLDAATANGASMQVIPSGDAWTMLSRGDNMPDFVIFWDKDVKLAKAFEILNIPVYNSSEAIRLCDDKADTYLAIMQYNIAHPENQIRQPLSFIPPFKYFKDDKLAKSWIDNVIESLGFPCIIKECQGSYGAQVYLINNRFELESKIIEIGEKPYIIQEYISSSKGHDIRLQVVGDKVVASMYRYNDDDFRANVSNGGNTTPYTPNEAQIRMALDASKALMLDFAGVDILFGPNNEPILCEVNSNAQFVGMFACTGINVADYILKYVIDKRNAK